MPRGPQEIEGSRVRYYDDDDDFEKNYQEYMTVYELPHYRKYLEDDDHIEGTYGVLDQRYMHEDKVRNLSSRLKRYWGIPPDGIAIIPNDSKYKMQIKDAVKATLFGWDGIKRAPYLEQLGCTVNRKFFQIP